MTDSVIPDDVRTGLPDPEGQAARDRLLERLGDLRRTLGALGDDLADGLEALAWRGQARDRFDRHLARRLDDLAMVVASLARAREEVAEAGHDPGRDEGRS